FWKSKEEPPEIPKALADVRQRVEEAWRMLRAREKEALPLAKKIADDLVQTGGDFAAELPAESKKAGHDLITVKNVAPLTPDAVGQTFRRDYFDFQLPKDLFVHPRDDMAAQLISLYDLKRPIETKTKEIDDLNKALFD